MGLVLVPSTARRVPSTPGGVQTTPGVVTSGPGVVSSTAVGVPSTPGAVPTTLAEQGTPSTPIELASPPSDITEFVDAFHEGEEVRFHGLDNIVSGRGSLGLAGWLLNGPELLLVSVEEPPTFTLAKRDANWRWAMLEEIKAIEENETWELIDPPLGYCPIGLKWVYKVKRDERGAIVKHMHASSPEALSSTRASTSMKSLRR